MQGNVPGHRPRRVRAAQGRAGQPRGGHATRCSTRWNPASSTWSCGRRTAPTSTRRSTRRPPSSSTAPPRPSTRPCSSARSQYPPSGGRYNTAVLWEPGVGVTAHLHQAAPGAVRGVHPDPLVRPARSRPAVDLVTRDMLPGDKPGYIPLDSERLGRTVGIGDVICFEVAYDDIVREAVRAGGRCWSCRRTTPRSACSDESPSSSRCPASARSSTAARPCRSPRSGSVRSSSPTAWSASRPVSSPPSRWWLPFPCATR